MAPSKLLMPLSYAALLGGTLTLIGTSTNLVVVSLAAKKLPQLQMGFFEIGIVGVPVTVASFLYMFALSGKLLPDRLSIQSTSINARSVCPVKKSLHTDPSHNKNCRIIHLCVCVCFLGEGVKLVLYQSCLDE